MQLLATYESASWFTYLSPDQQKLVQLAVKLYLREDEATQQFADYSFIVFPMAKAYEGFLKKYLFNIGLIPEYVYRGRKFRIGRALNPSLKEQYRDEHWLYDDVVQTCGKEVAKAIWETWLTCRNRVFHYFPDETHFLTLNQAGQYLELMMTTMDQADKCVADA